MPKNLFLICMVLALSACSAQAGDYKDFGGYVWQPDPTNGDNPLSNDPNWGQNAAANLGFCNENATFAAYNGSAGCVIINPGHTTYADSESWQATDGADPNNGMVSAGWVAENTWPAMATYVLSETGRSIFGSGNNNVGFAIYHYQTTDDYYKFYINRGDGNGAIELATVSGLSIDYGYGLVWRIEVDDADVRLYHRYWNETKSAMGYTPWELEEVVKKVDIAHGIADIGELKMGFKIGTGNGTADCYGQLHSIGLRQGSGTPNYKAFGDYVFQEICDTSYDPVSNSSQWTDNIPAAGYAKIDNSIANASGSTGALLLKAGSTWTHCDAYQTTAGTDPNGGMLSAGCTQQLMASWAQAAYINLTTTGTRCDTAGSANAGVSIYHYHLDGVARIIVNDGNSATPYTDLGTFSTHTDWSSSGRTLRIEIDGPTLRVYAVPWNNGSDPWSLANSDKVFEGQHGIDNFGELKFGAITINNTTTAQEMKFYDIGVRLGTGEPNAPSGGGSDYGPILDGNLQIVDLADLVGELPLNADSTTQILWQSQDWEHGSWQNPSWPAGGGDSLGMPTVVKNTHGQNQDGKYYLYYAHHDPMSGIGCAVADSISGPYTKTSSTDSKVLTVPNYNPAGPNPDDPSHYSSPSVVWNEDTGLWHMYFHYWNHYHGAWEANPAYPGQGYQMTGLATTDDLASHNWTIYTDSSYSAISVWDIVPVLHTTDEDWAKESTSYNAVQRLPQPQANGDEWLAFMRGTKVNGKTELGFATSANGKNWTYFPENPVIHKGATWSPGAVDDVYRPKFIGYLGNGEYLVAWSETDAHASIIYSKTTDFRTFTRDPRGYAQWGMGNDSIVSAWREGSTLYLFSGKYLYTMNLTVYSPADFDRDLDVDWADLETLVTDWLKTENLSADIYPVDGDGIVDFMDFKVFAEAWLE